MPLLVLMSSRRALAISIAVWLSVTSMLATCTELLFTVPVSFQVPSTLGVAIAILCVVSVAVPLRVCLSRTRSSSGLSCVRVLT